MLCYEGDNFIERVDEHLDNIRYTFNVSALVNITHAPTCANNCRLVMLAPFVVQSDAGKATRAVSKTMENLDKCGIEVAGCRHGFVLKDLNMFCGEMQVISMLLFYECQYV